MKVNGFYRLALKERRDLLAQLVDGLPYPTLDQEIGEAMIENFVAYYQMPMGIATNLSVDGKIYQVPMVTEEPSVVAAASNGAKLLGNISTEQDDRLIVGQMVLTDIDSMAMAKDLLDQAIPSILKEIQILTASMVKRGGGVRRVWTQIHEEFLTLYLAVDSQEAMGANMMNQLLEDLAPQVETVTGGQALLKILSNHQPDTCVRAHVSLPIQELHNDPPVAKLMADRIAAASRYAQLDPYRAVTHNKGIMNGIDAVVVATGNDWRAINAGVHAFASQTGTYQPLATWRVEKGHLLGNIELPLALATVGGTLKVQAQAQWAHALLGNPTVKELGAIIAALGLAQNFAALRALVTDGIQKGHMGLHAKQLAVQVGASDAERDQLIAALKQAPKMSEAIARDLLEKIRQS